MAETYEVGRYYMVPCVRGRWGNRIGDFPVIGGFHEDADIIHFTPWHWHIDFRFLSKTDLRIFGYYTTAENHTRVTPLMLHPDQRRPGNWFTPVDHSRPGNWFTPANHPRPVMRRRKCKRQYSPYSRFDHARWIPELEKQCGVQGLRNGHCPHRGADLRTLPVDRFGCVECPLHGLVFKAATGEMVPRSEWQQWRDGVKEA